MVRSSTNLTRNGLTDWLVQRVSAVVIAAYLLFLLGFLVLHSTVSYELWFALLSNTAMRVFSLLFVLSLIAHAWVGMWTVVGDYIKCSLLRGTLQIIIILSLLACLCWGITIIWGL